MIQTFDTYIEIDGAPYPNRMLFHAISGNKATVFHIPTFSQMSKFELFSDVLDSAGVPWTSISELDTYLRSKLMVNTGEGGGDTVMQVVNSEIETFSYGASQAFTLAKTPSKVIWVSVDNIDEATNVPFADFTVLGAVVTVTQTLIAGDKLTIRYESRNELIDPTYSAPITETVFNPVQTKVAGITAMQSETIAFKAAIDSSGGMIGINALQSVDRFIQRGKLSGWYQLMNQIWIPSGDFVASKIPVKSATAFNFNNFVDADYSQERGYLLRTNTDKYISTGVVPTSQGMNSKNLSIAMSMIHDTVPTNFGRILGTATIPSGDDATILVSNKENTVGVLGLGLNHSFGGESTTFVSSFGTTTSRMYLNGTNQMVVNSVTATLGQEINLFRSMRGNGMQYATGSVGFYGVGQQLTQAQQEDMNFAIMDLMGVLRDAFKRECIITEGDSIDSGSGISTNDAAIQRWSKIFANKIGCREQNNAQGSSRASVDDAGSGAVSLFNRYSGIRFQKNKLITIMIGTNDLAADGDTNGNATLANTYSSRVNDIVQDLKPLNHRIMLLSPPYRSDSNETKQMLYLNKLAVIAKAERCIFVDTLHAFLDDASPSSFLADGVHPNNAGHARIAEYAYEAYMGRLIRRPILDFASIAANANSVLTVVVPTAIAGMTVQVGLPAAFAAGLVGNAWVSADDTVSIRLTNTTGSAIDPASGIFKITVFTNL